MVLTKRQKEVLDFIQRYMEKEGVAPSFEEIAAEFNFSSKGTVYRYIHTLEKKGFLFTNKNKSRSIRLADKNHQGFEVPIIGTISRRDSVHRFKIPEYFGVSATMGCDSNSFAYLIEDNSFREEYVLKRDVIVIDGYTASDNPVYCLVEVDKREYLIKYFQNENNIIRLQSKNSDMLPLFYEPSRVRIIGRIAGIVREF